MAARLFAGLRPLSRKGALRDALAGMTLASINIPQVLGYTRIAGMPVVSGLYTVLLPLLAFATFGSSRHLVVAADSATAALLHETLSQRAAPGSERYLLLVGAVALLTAGLLLLARVLRLGFLADFLSRTVLVGFLAGVGIQVGTAMLPDMLGVAVTATGTAGQLRELAWSAGSLHPPTLALSAAVVAAILVLRRPVPRLPVPLVAVVASIAASAALGWAEHGIAVVGAIPGGLPALRLPAVSWRETRELFPLAASCSLIILAQSTAASRAFAVRHGEPVDPDADILGLAAANASAALSGTFVVNGSPTQTAVADQSGARSQLAQVVFSLVVVAVLLFFTGPLRYLPRAVLAGIVFTVAVRLVDLGALLAILRESPVEWAMSVLTAATVPLVGVEQGIVLAMGLSLLWHVRHSYRPHSAVLVLDAAGRWVLRPPDPGAETSPGLIVYRFGADLFYANDSRFTGEVRRLLAHAPTPVRWFVIDAGAITAVDYSAAQSVRELCQELSGRGVRLVLARVTPFLAADLDRHGLTPVLGPRIFSTLHEAMASLSAAGAPGDGGGHPG
ncbi:MAG TPA: SulP family inorganic anion transporter [Myxococcaceae bacterium]|nr:SulP family inorganic anion transporter [Myxococcaceae bacterium]